ncbi:MAG TPA: hypothetical protein VK660_10915, partial [Xanthomonadaceae bacterium]|nr:hypothetical protein [Xanthomonadaceae bacterium]
NLEATHVLDLLARAEAPMPPDLLSSLIPTGALDLAWRFTRHLLADEKDGWSLFHNSFRLFILAQPHTRFGRPDEEHSARLYRQLVELARTAPPSSAQHRLELRYLLRAGDHAQALTLATPGFLRAQFLNGRPASDIQDDIRLAFASLCHVQDATIAFRLVLAMDETDRRMTSFDQACDVLDALIALGDLDAAEGCLAEAGERAYWLVDAWLQAGRPDRAQSLFERIEPLHDLARNSHHSHATLSHDREMVAWAQSAVHFRDADQIVAAVDRIVDAMRSASSAGFNDPHDFGYELREAAACAVGQLDPLCDIEALMVSYRLEQQSAGILMLVAASAAIHAGELARARELIDAALSRPERLERVSRGARRRAALDAAHNGLFDAARALYDRPDIPQVAELDDSVNAEDAKYIIEAVIDHAELAELLEQPQVEVPASKKPLLRPLQRFASEAGRLAGMRHRDPSSVAPGEIARSAAAFLTYVARVAPGGGGDHYFITQLGRAAPSVVRRLLATAGTCGPEELRRVVKEVDQILVEEPWARQRLDGIPQLLAEALFAFAQDQTAAEQRLEAIAADLQENTPTDQLIGMAKLIVAFVVIGKSGRAVQILEQMRDESLGYSTRAKKDPQYAMWRDLLRSANRMDSSQRAGRVALLVQHVSGMTQTEGLDAAYRLAHDIIVEAALCDPGTGWAVAQRLSVDEVIGWAGQVNALMIGTIQRAPDRYLSCIATWTSLCLPFYREPYFREDDEGNFIQHAVALAPANDVLVAVEKLATEIAIHAQADVRRHLLNKIKKSAGERGVASAQLEDAIARNSDKAPVQNGRV